MDSLLPRCTLPVLSAAPLNVGAFPWPSARLLRPAVEAGSAAKVSSDLRFSGLADLCVESQRAFYTDVGFVAHLTVVIWLLQREFAQTVMWIIFFQQYQAGFLADSITVMSAPLKRLLPFYGSVSLFLNRFRCP